MAWLAGVRNIWEGHYMRNLTPDGEKDFKLLRAHEWAYKLRYKAPVDA